MTTPKKSKKVIKIPIPESHDEWKKQRLKGIGGSDAAAAIGRSTWKSPYYLWCEKTWRIHNDIDNEAMRLGRDMEEYVAYRFCEATGKKVRKSKYSFQSVEYPFMLANVDRLVIGEDAGLECKTTSALTRTKYDKGDIPIQYYIQCMHYMAVTGKKKWYIAVLVLGKGFYWFEVLRDEDEIQNLICLEKEFWHYVETDEMPPVDGSESTSDALRALYPEAEESYDIDLYGADKDIQRYEDVKELIKKLTREKVEIENKLKKQLGNATYGHTKNKRVVWKNSTQSRVDSDMLRKKYPEIFKECLKEIKQRRFSIKEEEIEIYGNN